MYKVVYECDCCGKEMQNPKYTLELKTDSLYVQDRASWHYCNECWIQVKHFLSGGGVIYKDNSSPFSKCGCYITTTTSDEEKVTQGKPIIDDKFTYSSPYTSYTISTNGEKTIQAEPAGDGPFTAGCCENINKDSLNYKQTTEI